MKVKVTQKEDFHFVGIGEAGREVPIDAAGYVGGKGRGIRPPELLFHSIAGCVGIHLYEALHHEGKQVDHIEIETDADRKTEGYPKVFLKIYLTVKVRGKVTEEDVKKALDKAIYNPGTCSIAYMIHQVAPIEYRVELIQ
ncbi:OsmC family protein [Thermocrinis albus DSM 14484]|uniref:OsmC family protein n=1 Tax=Thermocrinis albus (strain DSM 14484 / JCM 11386 / HI 11/12) TaxID=638303 RepID=D3SP14_THEAH|nr:OsmC family protein [Thermocrinis albus]ADC88901.1 OsmC family protein [Thermocrinis albus DSM 14484]